MIKLTPPMGWNSWNTYGTNINEELIKETADAMVETGLLDAGYDYLVIDDCWSERQRDENGRIVPCKEKFPNGMKAVADYVHSKGLKFGMYSCAGNYTCAVYPGSFEYEFIDAATFAEWGVDFLKYDYCFKPYWQQGHLLYKRMGFALANCGRDILFSACSWGVDESHKWIKETGAHMWRSTGDIVDSWKSIVDLAQKQISLQPYNGQGCFNDMDMLIVGMHGKGNVAIDGCSVEEYRTHFSLWAFLNSPLMIGCDVRNMSDSTKDILMNKDIIAINQDSAARQPYLADNNPNVMTWVKPLEGGDVAIGFFNLTDSNQCPFLPFDNIGLNRSTGKALQLTNLWTGEDLGVFKDIYRTPVMEPHTCLVLRGKLVDAK
ncbi:MAG: alpha-galactosidase [Clostridiales bacterium GWF2_36_10]|nr:MAG: alpha-galactosidase [Clostridiales bacterium GWF2_36_10]HAN21895.1 alpha-galactosidase [Clostridiales bacterium]